MTASTRSDLDDISAVERDFKDRQEQPIRRERVYKMRLEELRKELGQLENDKISWMKTDPNMQKIRGPGRSFEECGLGPGRDRVSSSGPGDASVKRFRGGCRSSRTSQRRSEEKPAKVPKNGSRAPRRWTEAKTAKQRAEVLDKANQRLGRENGFLTRQFESQEDDRALLVKQLVSVKERMHHSGARSTRRRLKRKRR